MESRQMLIEEIKTLLPQRYPFLFIDRVESIDLETNSIFCIKNVSINENYFNGHFPGNSIMPGVLIVEAMAQAAGILGVTLDDRKEGENYLYLFAGADKVKFRQLVVPGDQLKLEAKFLVSKLNVSKFACKAYVNDKQVCSAEITCAKKEL